MDIGRRRPLNPPDTPRNLIDVLDMSELQQQ
jgi:hypothetical protein